MQKFSVVIVCKNEAAEIGRSIRSLEGVTDDIVVLDNGSTDGTQDVVMNAGARLIEDKWEGYGRTKNKAVTFAKYDWIFSLDADESIDEELKKSLLLLEPGNEDDIFEIRFKNFFGDKHLRFGEWGWDRHPRVFNRRRVSWNEAAVHEGLGVSPNMNKKKLKGYVLHRTISDEEEFVAKMKKYANLSAEKYAAQGRKSSWLKKNIAPAFSFLKYYVFKLGFLDGRAGWICAKMTSYYTFAKYARLLELNRAKNSTKSEVV